MVSSITMQCIDWSGSWSQHQCHERGWTWNILHWQQDSNPNLLPFTMASLLALTLCRAYCNHSIHPYQYRSVQITTIGSVMYVYESYNNAYLWQPNSTAPLGNQVTGSMTPYPTQPHYPDTEPTSPSPNLLMLSARLGSEKYQFYNSLVWLDREANSWSSSFEARVLPIQPPRPAEKLDEKVSDTKYQLGWPNE